MSTNTSGQTFKIWLQEVNLRLVEEIGIGVMDIADRPYRDLFEDDVPAAEVARYLSVNGSMVGPDCFIDTVDRDVEIGEFWRDDED